MSEDWLVHSKGRGLDCYIIDGPAIRVRLLLS